MVLASPIPSHGIETDDAVLDFLSRAENNSPGEDFLKNAKISYQQKLLLDCFDFQLLSSRLNYFVRLLMGNQNVIHISGLSDIENLQESAEKDIFTVSEKFKNQLQGIFQDNIEPEADKRIQERTRKASVWFQDKFSLVFDDIMTKLHVETDNKELGKRVNNTIENLRQEIKLKRSGVISCEKGFFLTAHQILSTLNYSRH